MPKITNHKITVIITAVLIIIAIIVAAITPAALRRSEINNQFEIAQQFLNDLDYESAILAFTKILEIDPNNARAREMLQTLYLTFIRAEWDSGNIEFAQQLMKNMRETLSLTEDPYTVTVTKEPTCGTVGTESWICNLNDDVLERDTPATEAHIWDDGTVTTAATCASEGVLTYSCTGCDAEQTDVIAMLSEHSWDNGTVTQEATYWKEGTTHLTCTVCLTEKTETIPVLVDEVLVVNDKNLETALREEINKPTGTLMVSDFANLTDLDLGGTSITDITPLAKLTNLTFLFLYQNNISDITPLANLTNLTYLDLGYNNISDISPLANLTNLTYLDLGSNNITDITPIAKLTNLTDLNLWGINITDWSPVAHVANVLGRP